MTTKKFPNALRAGAVGFFLLAASAGGPAAASEGNEGDLLPYFPWSQTGALASLDGPLPAPPAAPPKGNTVLQKLREEAKLEPGLVARPLAGSDDAAAFETSFGGEFKAALASAETADNLRLSAKLREAAARLDGQPGLQRLLLVRAAALALKAIPGGEDELLKLDESLGEALSKEVPADLTARVLFAEGFHAHAAASKAPPETLRKLSEAREAERLDLARLQIRHGHLDEARVLLLRAAKESEGRPAEEALRRELELVEGRLKARERFMRVLREADGAPEGGPAWDALAFFLLGTLHDEKLGSAAARRGGHLALKGYGRLEFVPGGVESVTRIEKLLDLAAAARPDDRPGIADLALIAIEKRLATASGDEAERLKALRLRAEEAHGSRTAAATTGLFTLVVPAHKAWIPSGIVVKRGQRYRITAEGKWKPSGLGGPEVDAAGDAGTLLPPEKIALGALVLQIGSSVKTISVGRELRLQAAESGELFFSMNDRFRYFEENSGELKVKLEAPAGAVGARPAYPKELAGRWAPRRSRNIRILGTDGTCRYRRLEGAWVPQTDKEALLRWENGAIERIILKTDGLEGTLVDNSGRLERVERLGEP